MQARDATYTVLKQIQACESGMHAWRPATDAPAGTLAWVCADCGARA